LCREASAEQSEEIGRGKSEQGRTSLDPGLPAALDEMQIPEGRYKLDQDVKQLYQARIIIFLWIRMSRKETH
jgi:hypothetical protein